MPPPNAGPAAAPTPAPAETTPIPAPRRSGGSSVVTAMTESTGIAAAPTPVTIRPATSTARFGEIAQSRLPAA